MEGEPQRKRRRGFGCNILLCNPLFCGWRIASVKNGGGKTALQLALHVLRVPVSPYQVASSCSPKRSCC